MPTAVPLNQLVDLALGSPEVGAVNFNILHTLLHAMISKLGIEEVKADINDHDRDFLSTSIKTREATSAKVKGVTIAPLNQTGGETDSALGDKSATASAVTPDGGGSGAKTWDKDSAKGDDSLLDHDVDDDDGTIPVRKHSQYHRLEKRVAEVSKMLNVLNSLPTTSALMAEIKGNPPPEKAVQEMWQSIVMKKRVDANAEGIEKLMNMVDDMMKELDDQREENKRLSEALKDALKFDADDFLKRLEDLVKETIALRNGLDKGLSELKSVSDMLTAMPTPEEFRMFVRWGDLEDALKGIRDQLENLNLNPPEPTERVVNVVEVSLQTDPVSSSSSRPTSAHSRSSSRGPTHELLDILESLGSIHSSHADLVRRVSLLEDQVSELASRPVSAPRSEKERTPEPDIHVYVAPRAPDDGEIKQKLSKTDLDSLASTEDLVKELKKLREDMQRLQDAVSKLQENMGVDTELRAQMEDLTKKILEDGEALKRLQKMLKLLESAIEKLNKTTQQLSEDSENKDNNIGKLFNLCETLERKKADKEYVAMEVDVKADKSQLEGKVNHHLFDTTTADMNRMIRDILDKLASNSDDWKNMLAKLTNDLDGKLDRLELNPLKDWLEKKLKALSKKLQDGNMQWTEDDAAGLKKQLIQHYHCLSCDKPVNIVPTGIQPATPASYGMPASRSPRPYTTYELEQIRQHAKRDLLEAALFGSPERAADFYATSRQCGGSHTLTLPHQRYSKFNTFSNLFREEEQEEIIPLHKEEVDVMGADGHIYRGRVERLEAKMPVRMSHSARGNRQNNAQTSQSPRQDKRPASARAGQRTKTPELRPGSGQGSRPQSARIAHREERSEVTTPPMEQTLMEEQEVGEINVEVPMQTPPVQGE